MGSMEKSRLLAEHHRLAPQPAFGPLAPLDRGKAETALGLRTGWLQGVNRVNQRGVSFFLAEF